MDTTFIDRVKTTLEQVGTDCPLDEMMDLCPDLTWNQMFLAIDDLSRRGEVRVTMDADRTYRVQVCRPEGSVSSSVLLHDFPVLEREQSVS